MRRTEIMVVFKEKASRTMAIADMSRLGRSDGVMGPSTGIGEDNVEFPQSSSVVAKNRRICRKQGPVYSDRARHVVGGSRVYLPIAKVGWQLVKIDKRGEDRRIGIEQFQLLQHAFCAAILRQIIMD